MPTQLWARHCTRHRGYSIEHTALNKIDKNLTLGLYILEGELIMNKKKAIGMSGWEAGKDLTERATSE